MTSYSYPLAGKRPWPAGGGSAFEPEKDAAPQRKARYRCARGHRFELAFAADARPPATFEHRCGALGHLEEASETALRYAERPHPAYGTPYEAMHREPKTPWEHLLERRPVAAGLLFGLLCYKPHFGLLVPVALASGGYWRSFAAASLHRRRLPARTRDRQQSKASHWLCQRSARALAGTPRAVRWASTADA